MLHPVGPEPPTVYWIRRGAALLVIVVLVVSILWLLRGGGDDGGSSAAVPEPAASASNVASASASPSPTSTEPLECPDASIAVTASTDEPSYAVGSTPRLTLTIENIGTAACLRDVGPKANELEITSGGYHVWSSDDCSASTKSKITLLEPGAKVGSSITWDGFLSQKGCPPDQSKAKAGNYDLTARNGKVDSEKARFQLVKG